MSYAANEKLEFHVGKKSRFALGGAI